MFRDGHQSLELTHIHAVSLPHTYRSERWRRSLITIGQIASHNGILNVTRSKWTRPPGSHLDVSFGGPPTAGLQVERAGQPPKGRPFPVFDPVSKVRT